MNNKNPLVSISASLKNAAKASAKAAADKTKVAQSKLGILSTEQATAVEGKNKFSHPGHLALCRNLADGDMAAGILLYRILGIWKLDKINRLQRMGREWIAMSRADWAMSAGLSDAEMKDRALPRLRLSCSSFVETRTMRITPASKNMLGISLDPEAMMDFLTPWDMYQPLLNNLSVSAPKPKYPYKTD